MKASRSRLTAVGFSALALIIVAGSFAWACTPQARLQIIPPAAGPSRTQITVSGVSGSNEPAPVEIRWNSATGPTLASVPAKGGWEAFQGQITIPDASPDVYYLVAVVGGQGVARAAYEVTAPGSSADPTSASASRSATGVASDLWSGLAASSNAVSAQPEPSLSQTTTPKGLMAGMAFLALGVMTLSGGAVLAFGRKRTAKASR